MAFILQTEVLRINIWGPLSLPEVPACDQQDDGGHDAHNDLHVPFAQMALRLQLSLELQGLDFPEFVPQIQSREFNFLFEDGSSVSFLQRFHIFLTCK